MNKAFPYITAVTLAVIALIVLFSIGIQHSRKNISNYRVQVVTSTDSTPSVQSKTMNKSTQFGDSVILQVKQASSHDGPLTRRV